MNSKYKTLEELKEELGNDFDDFMYKSNIELLNKIDKAIEYIKNNHLYEYISDKEELFKIVSDSKPTNELLEILGDNNE